MIQPVRPVILFLFLCVLATAPVLAASPESLGQKAEKAGKYSQALKHYTAAIQKTSPGSSRERKLQKKIIGIVRKMKRTPSLSEKVDRHLARGEAFVESGKSRGSFERAAREFRAATRLAPWMGQAYYNLGVVQEKAGRHDASMESFRMYLFASPKAPDARKVKRLIYKIEARKEEAQAQKAKRRDSERRQREAKLRKRKMAMNLSGKWKRGKKPDTKYSEYYRIKSSGGKFTATPYYPFSNVTFGDQHVIQLKVTNYQVTGSITFDWRKTFRNGRVFRRRVTGRLSRDGQKLVLSFNQVAPAGAVGDRANGFTDIGKKLTLYRKN